MMFDLSIIVLMKMVFLSLLEGEGDSYLSHVKWEGYAVLLAPPPTPFFC